MVVSQQKIKYFATEMGMLYISYRQAFSYIRESYRQLRGYNTSVTGCHYITLRGRWCDIIVQNMYAPTDDMKDRSYEKQDRAFDHFPKYHMNIFFFFLRFQCKSTERIYLQTNSRKCEFTFNY